MPDKHNLPNFTDKIFLKRVAFLILVATLCACESRGPTIDALRAGGELRVALLSVPHTYYLEPDGILGYDYELLREFCSQLGIKLQIHLVDNRAQAIDLLDQRKVHLAAGLVPVGGDLSPHIRYGPTYSLVQAQVIYKAGNVRPRGVDDLIGASVETLAGSIGESELKRFRESHQDLAWRISSNSTNEALLRRVNAGTIDYAVIPSVDFTVFRLKYPHLEIGFPLGNMHGTSWAVSERVNKSVDSKIFEFFAATEATGWREALWQRYYGHFGKFDFVDSRAFLRAYDERLPAYRRLFIDAGTKVELDWRLLAALSYQESHWKADARSPTGVRGLMMLTRATAKRMGVSRLDPTQAVDGGARYLGELLRRLPKSVSGDDRLWFAVAAYNIGLGHLEDARVLTSERGKDPNLWRDVREYLPLLTRASVAKSTRYGKARGRETVRFVTNIRRYFDALRQLERRPPQQLQRGSGADRYVVGVL